MIKFPLYPVGQPFSVDSGARLGLSEPGASALAQNAGIHEKVGLYLVGRVHQGRRQLGRQPVARPCREDNFAAGWQ